MLSYIIFLFICLYFKDIANFSMWQPIVVATTISSFFFAFADYFEEFANEYDEQYDIDKRYYETTQKFIDIIFDSAQKARIDLGDSNYISYIERTKDALKVGQQESEKIITGSKRLRKQAKAYRTISEVLIWGGFLSFLCILVFFDNIDKLLLPVQDSATVAAFAIIMLTQYLKALCADSFKKKRTEYEDYSNFWNSLYESFKKEEANHAD